MKKHSILKTIILSLLFMCVLTYQSHTQQQQPDQRTVTITLTVQQTEMVLETLGELPYKRSVGTIEQIISQAQAQLAPPPAPVDTPTVKKKETPKVKKK